MQAGGVRKIVISSSGDEDDVNGAAEMAAARDVATEPVLGSNGGVEADRSELVDQASEADTQDTQGSGGEGGNQSGEETAGGQGQGQGKKNKKKKGKKNKGKK